MNNKNKIIPALAILFFSYGFVELLSLGKLSFMVGSHCAFFTASNCVVPLTGLFGGSLLTIGIAIIRSLMRWMVIGANPLAFMVFHIPGIAAAWYWRSSSSWVKVGLPLLCMAAFILHPVAGAAWVYSLYWLIPIAVHLLKRESVFGQSLAATFMAHAIGSVLWAYMVPMAPAVWLGLLPIVAVERLLFASGMTLAYYAVQSAQIMWKQRKPVVA